MRRRWLSRIVILAAAALVSTTAAAAPEARAGDGSAVIVLVGGATGGGELATALTELLGRQQIDVRLVHDDAWRTGQLLAGKGDRAVWIYVDLRADGEAALYFRGPKARRYLLRRLRLSTGLDEMGREVIAEVVESSVQSLLRATDGLTRAEMRAAMARDRSAPPDVRVDAAQAAPPDAATPVPPPSDAAAPPDPVPPPKENPAATPSTVTVVTAPPPSATVTLPAAPPARAGGGRWSGWVAARYTYSWEGPDLGPGQGPGLEIGVERRRGPLALGARIAAERWLTQSVPTTNVDTTVQSSPVCLLLNVVWPMAETRGLALGVGGGVDVTRVTPGTVYDPMIAATAPQTHVVPFLRGELRYEMGGATWRVAAVFLLDAPLYDTHYDVDRGATTERAATPWHVRPGGALVLGWRPRWDAK